MKIGENGSTEADEPSSRGTRLFRLLGAIAGAAAVVWIVRGADVRAFEAALRAASWPLIALAAVLNLTVNTAARVFRWQALLPPVPDSGRGASFWVLLRLWLAGQLTNGLVPFRLGELVRIVGVSRRYRYPLKTASVALGAEKLVEGFSIAMFGLPLEFSSRPPPWLERMYAGLIVIAFIVLVAILRLSPSAPEPIRPTGRVRRFRERVAEAVQVLRHPRVWTRSVAWSFTSDATDVALLVMCGAAVGVHLSLAAWCAVFLAINLAIAIPAAPGHVGTLEAGAVLALMSMSVSRETALAVALIYHGVHLLPVAAGGVTLAMPTLPTRRSMS